MINSRLNFECVLQFKSFCVLTCGCGCSNIKVNEFKDFIVYPISNSHLTLSSPRIPGKTATTTQVFWKWHQHYRSIAFLLWRLRLSVATCSRSVCVSCQSSPQQWHLWWPQQEQIRCPQHPQHPQHLDVVVIGLPRDCLEVEFGTIYSFNQNVGKAFLLISKTSMRTVSQALGNSYGHCKLLSDDLRVSSHDLT